MLFYNIFCNFQCLLQATVIIGIIHYLKNHKALIKILYRFDERIFSHWSHQNHPQFSDDQSSPFFKPIKPC